MAGERRTSGEKKDDVHYLEREPTNTSTLEKASPQVGRTDYSGAHEKTDPKEIALVKKLDRWIMPMLWSMYWLNYLDRNAIALARLDDLEEDLGLTSSRKCLPPSSDVTESGEWVHVGHLWHVMVDEDQSL
jgi:hypothetical protein